MNAPKGASGYSRKDFLDKPSGGAERSTTLEMTGRGNFIVQMIASIATAIVTALGATSCMGA